MKSRLLSVIAAPALAVLALVPGCFGKVEPSPPYCPDAPPTCVTPSVSCAMPGLAEPTCDEEQHTWSCPAGSSVYSRAATEPTACNPFASDASPFQSLGGSLARVPVDGGRCLWVAETVTTAAGASLRNVGLLPSSDGSFATCPTTSTFGGGVPTPVVTIEGEADPTLLVQVDGGILVAGETRVLYRLFRSDPDATYGVTLLGGGFGTWDAGRQQIIVPGADGLLWDPSIDPGDASLVVGGTPYVWGCHAPPQFLSNPCALARLDGTTLDYLTSSGAWQSGVDVSQTATVFTSGPWISSVVELGGGDGGSGTSLLHVYADGFGSTLETHTASAVTGPWSSGPTLATCELPSGDSNAFCAGPVVHEEWMDPTRPSELVVSYGVGTTGTPVQGTASGTLSTSYWTKLAWASF